MKQLALSALTVALLFCTLSTNSYARDLASPSVTAPNNPAIRILADGDYFPTLIGLLDRADSSIDLAMFLFKTGKRKNNRPAMIRDALIRAASRKVKVRVYLGRAG